MTAWETFLALLALVGLVVLIPLFFWAWVDRQPQGGDVPLRVFLDDPDDMDDTQEMPAGWVQQMYAEHFPDDDVDEDIKDPSLATIEAALARTTDPVGRDVLLDQWAAKRRAS